MLPKGNVGVDEASDRLTSFDPQSSVQPTNNPHKNEDAAISSLPTEILAMIFEISCDLSGPRRKPDFFEIVISHVTQHWRAVALETPALWANILWKPPQQRLDRIAAYLHRSSSFPLYLGIIIKADAQEYEAIGSLCRLLEPHIGHCSRLLIRSIERTTNHDKFCLSQIIQCVASIGAPSLQHLLLHDWGNSVVDPIGDITRGSISSLKSLHLRCRIPSQLPSLGSVTAVRLTCITGIGGLDIFNILSSTPFLTHFELWEPARGVSWPSDVVRLPNLLFLQIETSSLDLSRLSDILIGIHAPSLQSLSCKALRIRTSSASNDWCSRVRSADKFPALRDLRLFIATGDVDLHIVAQAFPLIEDFTYVRLSVTLQNAVSQIEGYPVAIWPHLRNLALSSPGMILDSPSTAGVRDFLQRRRAMGCPIEKIRLYIGTGQAGLMWARWLREYVEVEEFVDNWPQPFLSDCDEWM